MPRRFVSRVLFAVLLVACASSASVVRAAPPQMEPDEVIIKFKPGASQSDINSVLSDLHATRLKHFNRIRADHERISGLTVAQAISRYHGHRAVEFIEPNYIVQASSVPNDPNFGQLWGLRNTGQVPGGVPGADIDAVQAWDVTTGSQDIVVAIIDSGIDYNHPDLAENIFVNPGEIPGNGMDDDHNGFIDDIHGWDFVNFDNNPIDDLGHGTHCAGTVGAVGDNGIGVVGVNWHVRLLPVKFLNAGGFGSTAGAIASIEYATMMGVQVMSNSWGGGGFSEGLRQAIQNANDAGILFVAAAGNGAANTDFIPNYPSNYDVPNVISVAATNAADVKAGFSNYGVLTVDLAAPGVEILSTTPGNTYSLFSGTSMATPHVAGALALVLARFPGITASSAKTLLLNTVEHLPSLDGLVLTGGRLNAARALAGLDSIPPDPVADLSAVGTGSNRVELDWTATGDDGGTGTATEYEIRYATFAITEANFNTATRFLGAPPPSAPGSHEHVVVNGLVPSTTYYIAMKVRDEFGNPSPVSNLGLATTLVAPDIDVTPGSLSASLLTGASTTRTLTVRNTTAGTLDFGIDVDFNPGAPPDTSASQAPGGPYPAAGPGTRSWSDYAHAGAVDSSAGHAPAPAGGAAVLPNVITDPADAIDSDLIALRALSNRGQLQIEMEFRTDIDPFDFGGFLSFDADQNRNTGFPPSAGNGLQDVGVEYECDFFSLGSHVVNLRDPATGVILAQVPVEIGARTLRFTLPLDRMGNDDGFMDVTGVVGDFFGPTDWFPDSGHGTITGLRWLTVDPAAGTVPPGGSVDLAVRFDASGLFGGGYDGSILIGSNDPDESEVVVPAHLDVTGVTDITLSAGALGFGPVFLGVSRLDSLVVSNEGTDRLDVTEVSSDNADFSVSGATFSLDPGEHRVLMVTFHPSSVGGISGSLMIRSNDPDEGVLAVSLMGVGVVPPEISVSPTSLSSALLTGQTETKTLTISNTGGSDLTLVLNPRNAVSPIAGHAPSAASPGPGTSRSSPDDTPVPVRAASVDSDASVLVIQDSEAWGLDMGEFLLDQFGIVATVIHADQIAATDFAPFDLIITVGDESDLYYDAVSANVAKFGAFVQAGGVVQYQLATQGVNVLMANGVNLRFGNLEFENRVVLPGHPIVLGLPPFLEGNYANHAYITNLPAGAKVITETSISHVPTTVEYSLGAGTVVATGMTWEYAFPRGYNYGPMLVQSTAYSLSLAHPPWLSVNPMVATVPPGGSVQVSVRFDASGLFGGGYDGLILIGSNDPDESQVVVPAHLNVTGVTDIALSTGTLGFGPVFLGVSRLDSLVVSNQGTDELVVTEVSSDNADFSVPGSPFSLNPGEHRALMVTFAPTSVGGISGTLRIRSNDPDEGELTVSLIGVGVVPPEISVSPTSLSSALLTGQTETKTLTISNTGGSDLTFEISTLAVNPAAATTIGSAEGWIAPDKPRVGVATSAPRGPTPNETAPSSQIVTLAGEYSGTHLHFGISDYGELMPFQYPIGNEHLEVGGYYSGYTVAYFVNGEDHGAYAAFGSRGGILPVSYQELTNTPTQVIVEVVTQTDDYDLEITRRFTFFRNQKSVQIETTLRNISGVLLQNVAFKAHADWDMDGDYSDDTWDYDVERNMVVASDVKFAAIAGGRAPDLMDLYGWNDYYSRSTTVDFPTGPVFHFDGMALLHFEMGDLSASTSTRIVTAYGAADNLEELRQVMARAVLIDWLKFTPAIGTVPPGSSAEVQVMFDANRLFGGDYAAAIKVASNDPTDSEINVPAALHVTGVPVIHVEPAALDFGTTFLGVSVSRDITVLNDGTDILSITAVGLDQAAYTADASTFTLDPGASRLIHVVFAPTVAGVQAATLSITHNADGSPTLVALTGEGLVPPVIALSPPSLQANLPTDGRQDYPLLVRNEGGSDLHFTVQPVLGATSVTVHEPITLEKGQPDPRVGEPVATGSGGPDQFGYRWIDSGQPGGPAFGWVDITGVGAEVPILGDDVMSLPIPIGFSFPFYASNFTSFQVSTNGFLSFTSSVPSYVNQPLPSPGAPENMLAAFWDDLFVGASSHVYTHTDGTRMVVEYQNVFLLGGSQPLTFEIILFPSGTILYQYQSLLGPTQFCTVGIQNASQTDGLTIAFDTPYLHDNLAIRIASAPSWLSVTPEEGTVPPGGAASLQATVDATGIFPGDYPAGIRFGSNDPVRPSIEMPVTLHVQGVPHLETTPNAFSFGDVFVGQTVTRTLTLRNTGTDVLHVASIVAGLSDYSLSKSAFNLPALQSTDVIVTFTPAGAGNKGTVLTITSDDPASPRMIPVTATALIPPVVGVTPAAIVAASLPGGQKQKTLRVCNTGGSGLHFTVPSPLVGLSTVPQGSYAENLKGGTDSRPGVLGTGGPDVHGHIWADSDDPGGPAYEWIDITASGTRVPFGFSEDDRTLGPFAVGFGFPYYDAVFDSFRVCTNGWVSFTSGSASFDNQPLPNSHAGVPENLLAALWDDLLLQNAANGSIYYKNDGSKLIIQFNNLRPFNVFSPKLHTFEILLYPSGEIRYQYLSIGALLGGATVGIQNGARDDGLTVSFNSAYLHDGMAVSFTEPPRWITVSPNQASVAAGGCVDLAVQLDATQLSPADYAASIAVMSNDPVNPRVVTNALFHVGSVNAAAANISPNSLNLDSNGRFVKAWVELPSGLDPNRTVLSTVRFQGQIPGSQAALVLGDFNHNGIPDLEFQFDRAAVEQILPEGEAVQVSVTGEVEDLIYFTGSQNIRVIRPHVNAPNGGEALLTGAPFEVRWTNPTGWHVDHADLHYSTDDGASWSVIAQGVTSQSYSWAVPSVSSTNSRVRVTLYDEAGIMGYDTSDGVFRIAHVTAVETEEALPKVHALFQNSPNPFNPRTTLRFDLPAASDVRLVIYDVEGRAVKTVVDGALPAGRHKATWDGRDRLGHPVATGVYFYRLKAGNFLASRRMLLLK